MNSLAFVPHHETIRKTKKKDQSIAHSLTDRCAKIELLLLYLLLIYWLYFVCLFVCLFVYIRIIYLGIFFSNFQAITSAIVCYRMISKTVLIRCTFLHLSSYQSLIYQSLLTILVVLHGQFRFDFWHFVLPVSGR